MLKQCQNPILTANQMKMAEKYMLEKHARSVDELMQRAGQAIAMASNRHKRDGGRILIVVGKGNNAGDGFVAARLLRHQQIPVTVIPLLSLDHVEAHIQHHIELALKAGVKIRPALNDDALPQLEAWLSRAVLVVDAIFGTGLTRPVTGWLAQAILCMNQSHCPILAVDIASGIHADSGEKLGVAIKADITLPIAAYKWGHWLQAGAEHSGLMLEPTTIGILHESLEWALAEYPVAACCNQLIDKAMITLALPVRAAQGYKQSFGHVWVLGGSVGYTGAAKLAAMGAQAVGAGLVSIACPDDVYAVIASQSLEVMVHPQTAEPWSKDDVVVAGPGWGFEQRDILITLLESEQKLVLDADALTMLANDESMQSLLKQRDELTILTPHAGEAGRLLKRSAKEVQKDRLDAAISLVDRYQAWIVLKGAQTLVISPEKEVWVNPFGSVNLATAGTGDVLAGMIGGLLAGGLDVAKVVPAAVALHGLAGEQQGWFRAGQLGDMVAEQIQQLRNSMM